MTKTIKSFTGSTRYFLTIDNETGLATECTCKDRHYCPNREGGCKHMRDFNAEVVRAEIFAGLMARFDFRSQAQRDARATARINFEMALGY